MAALAGQMFSRIEWQGAGAIGYDATPTAIACLIPIALAARGAMAPPEGFEPPTPALGRRRSIL